MGDCSSKAAPPPKASAPQAKEEKPAANEPAAAAPAAAPAAAAADAPAAEARPAPEEAKPDYEANAAQACPAEVYMLSGCRDEQTSADVANVMSFGVPGPGGAGGACTNAFLRDCYKPNEATWTQILSNMVSYLEEMGYTQRPLLSTSRKTNLKDTFSLAGTQTGNKHALLIGINYVSHEKGRLNGCVNDVVSMKKYIASQGFPEDNMTFLIDEAHDELPTHTAPTKKNIEDAINTFVSKVQPGDALFFHYSGHGGQQVDTSGDEKDGRDEVLIPEDYGSAGVITDDELFSLLVAKLPEGVRLVCVMDCCHSGTILDLPFTFQATEGALQEVEQQGGFTMPNADFTAVLKKFLTKFGPVLSGQLPRLQALGKQFGIL